MIENNEIIRNNPIENKINSNNKSMEIKSRPIGKFIRIELEKGLNKDVACWRMIDVKRDANGKKTPIGDYNNRTPAEILSMGRGSGNSYSLYLKHIPNLYVIDYDTKEVDEDKFYDMLNEDCVAMTETKKGWHFYVIIKNMPTYSNQIKVYKNELYDVDLLHATNVWEDTNRIIKGDLIEYDWNNIKQYFNIDAMNGNRVSPPVSNTSSPRQSDDEEYDEDYIQIEVPTISADEFLKKIKSFIPRYDYEDWIKIGLVCFHTFNGNPVGYKFWYDYSRGDPNFKNESDLKKNWDYWNKKNHTKKISYKYFDRLHLIDYPPDNIYEAWYGSGDLVINMNKECMYYTKTGDILYYNNGETMENKPSIARTFYSKYKFEILDGKKTIKINPFDIWLEAKDRRDVDKKVFKPKNDHLSNEFNNWTGFDYEKTGECHIEKLQPFLDHIKNIWANNDDDTYNYILNYFARMLQTPWNKNNICLVLHSVEGVGKSIILNLIYKIMGDKYYFTTSSLKHVIGTFNVGAENKILVNLNETNWGGNVKDVGAMKEFITDDTIVINEKQKSQYITRNYANTIITTNEDWIVKVDKNDRRFNLLECSSVKYNKDHYKQIANTDIQELANFFYTRDITNYDSRKFKKSELHTEQILKNLTSVEMFYGNLINREIDYEFELTEKIPKTIIYDLYVSTLPKCDRQKSLNIFWKDMKKISKQIELFNANKSCKPSFMINNMDEAIKDWNILIGKE